jgi:hypothetical protein
VKLIERGQALLDMLGVDRAIYFVVMGRLWMVLAGVVNLVAITGRLSPVEQGYFYTFASMLSAQVFFELGLTNVVMQFVSHERARLSLNESGRFDGDLVAKARLASLVRLSLRWYAVLAALFALLLGPVGFVFFSRNGGAVEHVPWQGPWVCLVLFTAGLLWLSPLLAILEGCGLVAEVAKFRLFQSIAAHGALWIALAARRGVESPAAFSLASLIIGAVWIWRRHGMLLLDLVRTAHAGPRVSWRREMFPFQWRIALSWVSGYFIAQLFTPMLFTYHGAAEAGRMGMSLAVTGAVSTLSLAWITTKAPTFGGLVAQGRFAELNALFTASFKRTLSVSAGAACLLVIGVWGLNLFHHPLAGRFLVPAAFVPLVLSTLVSVVVTAMAIFLRAFKREPFLVVSVLNGIFVSLSTYCLGRAYGATAMTIGYLIVNSLVGLGLGWWIFVNKRRAWTLSSNPCAA